MRDIIYALRHIVTTHITHIYRRFWSILQI